jgi:hypothetical protein
MHLDRTNIASKNNCENANTLAHDEIHLVVLARLRRQWSLSGREALGSSLPPAELARRDSGVFKKLKRLFFTTLEVRKETEANGGHRGDRTLDRTWSLFDQTRPVDVQRLRVCLFLIGHGGTSGHSRSDRSSRSGSLLDSNRTLALWRPVSSAARPVAVSLSAAQA